MRFEKAMQLIRLTTVTLGMIGSFASANGCAAPSGSEGEKASSAGSAATEEVASPQGDPTKPGSDGGPTVTSGKQKRALSLFEKSGAGSEESGTCSHPVNPVYNGESWSYFTRDRAHDAAESEARENCRAAETYDPCYKQCDEREFVARCWIVDDSYWICRGDIRVGD